MGVGSVDFYLLEAPSDTGVLKLACKVVEKAWQTGCRVAVVARDDTQNEQLDDLLWTFSQASFIPHALQHDDGDTPVVLSTSPPEGQEDIGVVVTLHPAPLPETFHHLRIADIIGASDTEKREARLRYRYYRQCGMEPRTHRI
jgi:DNA polymerase III subunit chi